MFLGYIMALALVYVTAFEGISRLGVQSFWRYQTQLGPLGVLAAAVALGAWGAPLVGRFPRARSAAGVLAIALMVVLPFIFVDRLRRDLDPPKPFVRAVTENVSRLLPPDAGLALVYHRDNGNIIWLARGTLAFAEPRRTDVRVTQYLELDAGTLETIAASDFDHAWVYCVPPPLIEAMPLALDVETAYLLRHQHGAWTEVARWPHQPPAPTLITGSRKQTDYGCG